MKWLNLGSGEPRGQYTTAEWLNLDISRAVKSAARNRRGKLPRNFLLSDGCSTPFRDGSFEVIHAIHVLEHVPRDHQRNFLQEVRRLLTPEGVGFIEVPDFLSVCTIIAASVASLESPLTPEETAQIHEIVRVATVGVYGKGRHEGDCHHWGFTCWQLEALFRETKLHYVRESDMIFGHHRMEPVLLYRVWRI